MDDVDVREFRICTNEVIEEVLDVGVDLRWAMGVRGITDSRRCTFRKTVLRTRIRCAKRRMVRVNRRILRTHGILHPTVPRLVRRLGGSGALAPLLDSGREHRLMYEKEPSERDMKRRRTGLGQGEYGSVLT